MDDSDYLKKNPDWHAEDAPYKASWIKTFLAPYLNIDQKRVADIGCGSGEVLVHLNKYFPNTFFVGYEISSVAHSIASQKSNPPYLKFHNRDLLQQAPKPKALDLILCIDVFEHIPDHNLFLKSLSQYAENFIFHIPLELSVQSMLRPTGLISYREQYGHLHFFNRALALQTLANCGYQIIDWQYTPSALVLPGRNLKSRFMKLPRRLLFHLKNDFCADLLGGFSLLAYCRKEFT